MSDEFLYVLRPVRLGMLTDGPTDDERQVLERHLEHLRRLADDGVALLFGRTQTTDESTIGLVILRAGSRAEAAELMRADPAVDGEVMRAELFPYRIAGGSLAGMSS